MSCGRLVRTAKYSYTQSGPHLFSRQLLSVGVEFVSWVLDLGSGFIVTVAFWVPHHQDSRSGRHGSAVLALEHPELSAGAVLSAIPRKTDGGVPAVGLMGGPGVPVRQPKSASHRWTFGIEELPHLPVAAILFFPSWLSPKCVMHPRYLSSVSAEVAWTGGGLIAAACYSVPGLSCRGREGFLTLPREGGRSRLHASHRQGLLPSPVTSGFASCERKFGSRLGFFITKGALLGPVLSPLSHLASKDP
jgi:hypothetical protein